MDKFEKINDKILNPRRIIPPDLLKDKINIEERRAWVNRYGKIILLAQDKIRGDETIYCDENGLVYCDDGAKYPKFSIDYEYEYRDNREYASYKERRILLHKYLLSKKYKY